MTKLQRQFSKSRVLRRAIQEYCESEGISTKGVKRTLNSAFAEVFGEMPDYEIRRVLLLFLTTEDISPEELMECRMMLQIPQI